MLVSGLAVPAILTSLGGQAWHWAWLAMGIASAAAVWPSAAAVRRLPPAAKPRVDGAAVPPTSRRARLTGVWAALLSYALFAVGYLAYLTFLVAWMRDLGLSVAVSALAWAGLSVLVIASPFVWRPVLARARAGGAMAAANLATALAVALPLLRPDAAGTVVSAMAFGLSFFVVPTAATSFCRSGRRRWRCSRWCSLRVRSSGRWRPVGSRTAPATWAVGSRPRPWCYWPAR